MVGPCTTHAAMFDTEVTEPEGKNKSGATVLYSPEERSFLATTLFRIIGVVLVTFGTQIFFLYPHLLKITPAGHLAIQP